MRRRYGCAQRSGRRHVTASSASSHDDEFQLRSPGWPRRSTGFRGLIRSGRFWPSLSGCPRRSSARSYKRSVSSLLALRRRFDANFDGDGTSEDRRWFPAFALAEKPGLAALLRASEPSTGTLPEQGMRIMLELLTLAKAASTIWRNGERTYAACTRASLRPTSVRDNVSGFFLASARTQTGEKSSPPRGREPWNVQEEIGHRMSGARFQYPPSSSGHAIPRPARRADHPVSWGAQ